METYVNTQRPHNATKIAPGRDRNSLMIYPILSYLYTLCIYIYMYIVVLNVIHSLHPKRFTQIYMY